MLYEEMAMFKLNEDIHSLTDFKRFTSSYVKKLRENRRPMVLTVNGKAALVVQDALSYQKLLDVADQQETLSAIQEGLNDYKQGDSMTLKEFDKYFRKKHGIPR
jgi:hypothetical protein